jgi:hypothetical protein
VNESSLSSVQKAQKIQSDTLSSRPCSCSAPSEIQQSALISSPYINEVKEKAAEKTGVEKFQVLTAVSMKFTVFWDGAPCSHIEVD